MQEQLQVNAELVCLKRIRGGRLNHDISHEEDSFKIKKKKLRKNKEIHRRKRKSGKKETRGKHICPE